MLEDGVIWRREINISTARKGEVTATTATGEA